jgi:hypothetical protein
VGDSETNKSHTGTNVESLTLLPRELSNRTASREKRENKSRVVIEKTLDAALNKSWMSLKSCVANWMSGKTSTCWSFRCKRLQRTGIVMNRIHRKLVKIKILIYLTQKHKRFSSLMKILVNKCSSIM